MKRQSGADLDADADVIASLVAQISPLLSGQDPPLVGAVLCELMAMMIAGHIIPGNAERTDAMRSRLAKINAEMVRDLIPVLAMQIHGKGRG